MQIVYDPRHTIHAPHTAQGRVTDTLEAPARAETIAQAVRAAGLGAFALPEDYGLAPIRAVHAPAYLEFLAQAYAANSRHFGQPAPLLIEAFPTRYALHQPPASLGVAGQYASDADTPVLEPTWQAAYQSAQVALTGADRVLRSGETAYALCRPPGHHAYRDMYGGFCYLNNAAIAARYLQNHAPTVILPPDMPSVPIADSQFMRPPDPPAAPTADDGIRVAILDIDFHHGNGTQAIFYADPSVLFCSLHGHPDQAYPFYSGMAGERGEGAGQGFNGNWPLPPGASEAVYLAALDEALDAIRRFAPRFLVVSMGLDIAAGDPYGSFALDNAALAAIGSHIRALDLPTLLAQEGGYQLPQLGERAVAFLTSFV